MPYTHALHKYRSLGKFTSCDLATSALTTGTLIITLPILGSPLCYFVVSVYIGQSENVVCRQLPPLAVGGGCISMSPHCIHRSRNGGGGGGDGGAGGPVPPQ